MKRWFYRRVGLAIHKYHFWLRPEQHRSGCRCKGTGKVPRQ